MPDIKIPAISNPSKDPASLERAVKQIKNFLEDARSFGEFVGSLLTAGLVDTSGVAVPVVDTSNIQAAATLGYAPGSGGAVTQPTSKVTAVTLDKPTGRVTTHAAALAAGASAAFQVNNLLVEDTDVVVVAAAGPWSVYATRVLRVDATRFIVELTNTSAGSLSDAVAINFVLLKGRIA